MAEGFECGYVFRGGHAAGGDDPCLHGAAHRVERADVRPLQHAVGGGIGDDQGLHAQRIGFLGKIDRGERGRLGPALDLHLAVAAVDADGEPVAEATGQCGKSVRISPGAGAENHPRRAVIDEALDVGIGADADADLHGNFERGDDALDDLVLNRHALERAVEVHHMEVASALLHPTSRHRDRVLSVHGLGIGASLQQAHAASALQINRRENREVAHNAIAPKFFNRFSPACWLLSGWNCTAATRPRAMADT